jgi:DNA-binding beta-propeller fold protein YncE
MNMATRIGAVILIAAVVAACTQAPRSPVWKMVVRTQVGRTPGPVTLGGAWAFVPNMSDGTVTQIDRITGRTVATIRVGDPQTLLNQGCNPGSEHAYYWGSWGWRKCDTPYAIAWDGTALWALDNGLSQLVRVDPALHRTTDRISLPATGWAIAITGSTAWVSGYADHVLFHVDLNSKQVIAVIRNLDLRPASLTVANDEVWVACGGADGIGYLDRIDPPAALALARYPIGWYSDDVIADVGAIFVRTGGVVTRVNIRTGATEWSTVGPGFLGRPGIDEIGVAPNGLWLSGSSTQRMNPVTGQIAESIAIPSAAVTFGGGELWTLELDGTVTESVWG